MKHRISYVVIYKPLCGQYVPGENLWSILAWFLLIVSTLKREKGVFLDKVEYNYENLLLKVHHQHKQQVNHLIGYFTHKLDAAGKAFDS